MIIFEDKHLESMLFTVKSMDRLNKKWHDSTLQLYIHEVGALAECGKKIKKVKVDKNGDQWALLPLEFGERKR